MDSCSNPTMGEIQCLQDAAWEAIGTATVDGPEWDCYWQVWTAHCALYHHPSNCTQASESITDKLLTFAVAVREGKYGLGATVKVQSVKRALRNIAQKLILDGHPNPRKALPAQQQLELPISWLLKSFQDSDPAAEPKLALPVATISAISHNYRWNPHLDVVVDLVTVAFFYLLRVGEYTSPAQARAKRTIPLQRSDICLWKNGILLLHTAGFTTLFKVDSATICIANTKNGTKGAVIHHEAFRGPICPVAALARRVANLQSGTNMCTLYTVYHASGRISTVLDCDIGIVVWWGATYDGLMTKGYTFTRISSHSLRIGGAMAMKLSGASDSTIMRVGRWTSLTYLTYIHMQIRALTAGLAWCMSSAFTFQNVG